MTPRHRLFGALACLSAAAWLALGKHSAAGLTELASLQLPNEVRSLDDIELTISETQFERASLTHDWDAFNHPMHEGLEPQSGRRTISPANVDWSRFPRSSYDFVVYARDRPDRITSEGLYRHRVVNPYDVQLSEAQIASINSIIDEYRPILTRLRHVLDSCRDKELDLLQQLGQAIKLEANRKNEIAVPLGEGDGPFCFKLTATSSYGASISDLPYTYRAFRHFRFLGQEMGGRLINVFVRSGALPSAEAAILGRRLVRTKAGPSSKRRGER